MKSLIEKTARIFGSRAALNIYCWALIIVPRIDIHATAWEQGYTALIYLLMLALVYGNNLVLVPLLLARKKYAAYFLSIISLGLTTAWCYTFALKLLIHNHPEQLPNDLNKITIFLNGSLTPELTFLSTGHQMRGTFFALMTVTFIFTLAWYMRDYFYQQKIYEELRKKQTETELQFLKGQINPHFLFNTLNNLYGLSIEQNEHTPDAILKLSSILRYLLYESNSKTISFQKEKDAMLAYVDLELLRLSQKDNLNFLIEADGTYDIPPLLWLPVLENVFKHGTRLIDDDLMIDFRFTIDKNKINIYSKNKYRATVRNSDFEQSSGIGLLNLKQRLELIYPGNFSIQTKQEEEYYIVNVSVVLK